MILPKYHASNSEALEENCLLFHANLCSTKDKMIILFRIFFFSESKWLESEEEEMTSGDDDTHHSEQ